MCILTQNDVVCILVYLLRWKRELASGGTIEWVASMPVCEVGVCRRAGVLGDPFAGLFPDWDRGDFWVEIGGASSFVGVDRKGGRCGHV